MEREKPRCRNGEKGKLVLTRGLLGGLEIEDALEKEGCNRHGKQLDHSQGSLKAQGLRTWVTWSPLCGRNLGCLVSGGISRGWGSRNQPRNGGGAWASG